MATTSFPLTAGPHSNQIFEPPFEWVRRDDRDTLLLDVSGFKKEQLKVQVNNQGNLNVSGERFIYGNQRIHFVRDFQVPKDCDISEVRAKFQNGLLYVIMPKSISPQPLTTTIATTTTTTSTDNNKTKKSQSDEGKASMEANLGKDLQEKEESSERRSTDDHDGRRYEDASNSNGDQDLSKKKFTFKPGHAHAEAKEHSQLIGNTLVAILVLLALWIYFTYGLGSLLIEKHEVVTK